MKEIPTIKPNQIYLYSWGNELLEARIIAVGESHIRVRTFKTEWVSKVEFKTRAKELLGRYKFFLGFKLKRIE